MAPKPGVTEQPLASAQGLVRSPVLHALSFREHCPAGSLQGLTLSRACWWPGRTLQHGGLGESPRSSAPLAKHWLQRQVCPQGTTGHAALWSQWTQLCPPPPPCLPF